MLLCCKHSREPPVHQGASGQVLIVRILNCEPAWVDSYQYFCSVTVGFFDNNYFLRIYKFRIRLAAISLACLLFDYSIKNYILNLN